MLVLWTMLRFLVYWFLLAQMYDKTLEEEQWERPFWETQEFLAPLRCAFTIAIAVAVVNLLELFVLSTIISIVIIVLVEGLTMFLWAAFSGPRDSMVRRRSAIAASIMIILIWLELQKALFTFAEGLFGTSELLTILVLYPNVFLLNLLLVLVWILHCGRRKHYRKGKFVAVVGALIALLIVIGMARAILGLIL